MTSLEELLTYYRGSPCIYNQRSITNGLGETWYGPEVDEDWTNSTLVIGVLGTEPATQTAKSYFTNNTLITASFPSGADRAVNYYSCRQRQLTAMPISTHNCNPIGKGSYDIETLGDARVLRLKSLPSQIAGASVERVYVERAAAVFKGRKTKPALARETQLNLVAANALFSQIGIPAIVP